MSTRLSKCLLSHWTINRSGIETFFILPVSSFLRLDSRNENENEFVFYSDSGEKTKTNYLIRRRYLLCKYSIGMNLLLLSET